MPERLWTDHMRALVRLLGLMRREGRAGRKTVQHAVDAVRDGLVSAYEESCWRAERMAQVAGR